MLHSGGLRSLVATAMLLNRPEPARLTLLHVHDGRDAGAQRLEHLRQQADHYALTTLHEIGLPMLYRRASAHRPDGRPWARLATPQLLLAAYAHALELDAAELHWPIAVDGRPEATARAQEFAILTQQLADADVEPGEVQAVGTPGAGLVMPLLGYTDVQVVELGAGLGVPWESTWSCVMNNERQCGSCPACRRRSAAFRAAGVVDPAFAPAGVR